MLGIICIAVMMVYVFAFARGSRAVAYVCYVLSANLFVSDAVWFTSLYREKIKPGIKSLIDGNRYLSRPVKDAVFNTVVKTYLTLICNLFYVLLNLASGIYDQSLHILWRKKAIEGRNCRQ